MDDKVHKPKLNNIESSILLYQIASYARKYCKDKKSLQFEATADVMDGTYIRADKEVQELIKKKIIEPLNGSWILTDYGVDLLYQYKNEKEAIECFDTWEFECPICLTVMYTDYNSGERCCCCGENKQLEIKRRLTIQVIASNKEN